MTADTDTLGLATLVLTSFSMIAGVFLRQKFFTALLLTVDLGVLVVGVSSINYTALFDRGFVIAFFLTPLGVYVLGRSFKEERYMRAWRKVRSLGAV